MNLTSFIFRTATLPLPECCALPGARRSSRHTMEDIVTARADYARLDDANSPIRIRLNSTAVRAKHIGDSDPNTDLKTTKEVEVTTFAEDRPPYPHRALHTRLLQHGHSYLCPEMPDKQKEALAYSVKMPLVYTNVQIRNWKAFQKLGISAIYAPEHTSPTSPWISRSPW